MMPSFWDAFNESPDASGEFYVYTHKSELSGHIFYVGKGKGRRCTSKKGRTDVWMNAASKGFVVDIVKDNLSEIEALREENRLIDIYSDTCVNIRKSRI